MLKSFQKLGSSAGIPTQERGVTSLIISDDQYDIMVDCGEGTYLNWNKANYRWRRLKYIFITHMHPDHTGGLVPLIFYRNILRIEPKLTIYGPPNLKEYLMDSFKHQGLNLKFELDIHNIENHDLVELENDISLSSVELEHKIPCWGFKFRDENNSVVFITDSLPCENVVNFAKDCTHFIHEATFTDEHKELAIETKHTTFSQAVELGKKANVENIYLTHFSPRIENEELEKLEKELGFVSLHRNYKCSL